MKPTNVEITTSNKLEMNINKDDLIDILIDEKLTSLENELLVLNEKKQALGVDKIYEKKIKQIENKVLSLVPKELKNYKVISFENIYTGYSSKEITVCFENFSINIPNVNTNVSYTKAEELENQKRNALYKEVLNKISSVDQEILNITKSGKRIKAKMIKSFLENSKEGKSILSMINKTDIKLLKE